MENVSTTFLNDRRMSSCSEEETAMDIAMRSAETKQAFPSEARQELVMRPHSQKPLGRTEEEEEEEEEESKNGRTNNEKE